MDVSATLRLVEDAVKPDLKSLDVKRRVGPAAVQISEADRALTDVFSAACPIGAGRLGFFLYMSTPGGRLGVGVCGIGWCASQHIAALQRNPPQIGRYSLNAEDTKPEMRPARERTIPSWVAERLAQTNATNAVTTNTLALSSPPSSRTSSTTEPRPEQPASFPPPNPTKVGIGIMWAQKNDIDLYVRPSPTSAELNYKNTSSPEGVYYHDYRTANEGLDFEYVELKQPVDLKLVKAFVNFYAGHDAPVTGRVCVHYEGKTYFGAFAIEATHGNGGVAGGGRANSPFWTELDLLAIVGLERQASAGSFGAQTP